MKVLESNNKDEVFTVGRVFKVAPEGMKILELSLSLTNITLGFDNEENLVRTPLGGFINHSEAPNCELLETGRHYVLRTLRHIKRGEELTVQYRWYDPREEE